MKKLFLILTVGIFLTSCRDTTVKQVVAGVWSIDTIYYKNYNIKHCMLANLIFFKFDKQSSFPYAENYCNPAIKNNFDEYGDIEILHSENANDTIPFRLKINSKNQIFAGLHKIVFYKDISNKVFKMEIFSDKLYIICRKGLWSFDDNINLMTKLEKMTWTNRPKSAYKR